MIKNETFLKYKIENPSDSLKVASLKEAAFQKFNQLGWPTKKLEAWKFTTLRHLSDKNWFLPTQEETHLSHDELKSLSTYLSPDFKCLVFVDGFLNKTLSDSDLNFESVALDESIAPNKNDSIDEALEALNFAFVNRLVQIKIGQSQMSDKNATVKTASAEESILILNVVSQKQKNLGQLHQENVPESLLSNQKIEIYISKNMTARVLFHSINLNELKNQSSALLHTNQQNLSESDEVKSLSNVHLTFHQEPDSFCKFIHIQNFNENHVSILKLDFNLKDRSNLMSLDLKLGGQTSRTTLTQTFHGQHAESHVLGLSVLANQQMNDDYTFIHHKRGENNSVQHYKSILSDRSQNSFRGRIKIDPQAQKANSEQLSNSLLISKAATTNSVPQLEIYADDVKAGHGSTVGQLNADEIFYFLSRGISESKAIQMLSEGFALDLIHRFENAKLQDYTLKYLNAKLEEIF